MVRLILLGGPGAGKTTQARALQQRYSVPWIAAGEMLRQAIVAGNELGTTVQTYVEQGELVPDHLMIALIRQRLLQPDVTGGWIMSGYPRTAFQAEELDFLLDELTQALSYALSLEVPEAVLLDRSLSRARADDTPEIIQRRVELYQDCTVPILEYYDMSKRLLRVAGDQPVDTVHQAIVSRLGV